MPTTKIHREAAALSLVVMLLVSGCGNGDWGSLSGVVQVNGEPVGPGTISFEPVDKKTAGASATFGEDGKYAVMSAGRKAGAAAGEYRVTIHGGEDFGVEHGGPRPASKIPARYGNPTISDLTVTIESGSTTHNFDLKP